MVVGTTPLRGMGWVMSGLVEAADRRRVFSDADGQARLARWQERRRRQQQAVRHALTARAGGMWGAGAIAAGSMATATAVWSPWSLLVGSAGATAAAAAGRLAWTTTIPHGPDPDDIPPARFPTVRRSSMAYPLLSRAVAARAVTLGVTAGPHPLAEVVGRATAEGEHVVAGLARRVLQVEEHRARVGWSVVVDDALRRAMGELERAVVAFESLAVAAAEDARSARVSDPLSDFEARVEGVRAAARTVAP